MTELDETLPALTASGREHSLGRFTVDAKDAFRRLSRYAAVAAQVEMDLQQLKQDLAAGE
jgi:hypothetical protein